MTTQVKTGVIADGAITTTKIADANVTAAKLASGAAASNLGSYVTSVNGSTGAVTLSSSANLQSQVFAASGSWTAPTGVTKVKALVVGAGSGNFWLNSCCSNYGASGGLAYGYVTVVPGTVYTVTVGTASVGVSSGTSGAGGASSFGALMSATGGGGSSLATGGTYGTGSGGTLRNTYTGRDFGSYIPPIGNTGNTTNTPLAWTPSNNVIPGYLGAYGGLRAGVNGLVFLEWVAS